MFGQEATAYVKAAIEGRYRLLPYIYTQFRRYAETGMPVLRSLPFNASGTGTPTGGGRNISSATICTSFPSMSRRKAAASSTSRKASGIPTTRTA